MRRFAAAVIAALLAVASLPSLPPPTSAATTTTVPALADVTIRADRADRNFGADPALAVDGSPLKRVLFTFSVSGIGANRVTSAVLRLHNVDGSRWGGALHATSGGWSEGGVTWQTAPQAAAGAPIATLDRVNPGTWYALDLTSHVSADGTYHFVLISTNANGADYASKEAGAATAPQLVITTEPGVVDDEPPSQPTGLSAVAESASRVRLTWQPSGDDVGVVAYDVYRDGASLATVSASEHTDTSVLGGVTYEYVVVARDAAGNASPPSAAATATTPAGAPVLVGAGDISDCVADGDEATATLLDGMAGTVITLGDTVYPDGTSAEFTACYAPTWGRHLERTMPSVGNHEYHTPGAAGYYGYFGSAAGDPAKGYYAYTRGAWRIIVLNSSCSDVGGCGYGSPQDTWLVQELADHAGMNVLAYWHHPRFSSGSHGNDPRVDAFWQRLYDAGADLILNGHDHNYERFAPQNPTGGADATYGIRQFIVGTGGRGLGALGTLQPNSEVWDASAFGVLSVTLEADAYSWRFVPVAGRTFTDSGTANVHPAPPPDATPPSAPSGLTATSVSTNSVTIAWDPAPAAEGVTAYEVFRASQSIGQTTSTTFTDPNVLPGTSHEYRVRARDAAANWSDLSAPLSVTTPAPPSTLSLEAAADATIRPDRANRNYGLTTTLEIDASSKKDVLLAFDVPDLGGSQVVSATLYLYCVDASDSGGQFFTTAPGWQEQVVTWDTAPPAVAGPVATIGPVASATWYTVDLTAVISGAGPYSFRISSDSANGADYASGEAVAGLRPTLVLQLGSP